MEELEESLPFVDDLGWILATRGWPQHQLATQPVCSQPVRETPTRHGERLDLLRVDLDLVPLIPHLDRISHQGIDDLLTINAWLIQAAEGRHEEKCALEEDESSDRDRSTGEANLAESKRGTAQTVRPHPLYQGDERVVPPVEVNYPHKLIGRSRHVLVPPRTVRLGRCRLCTPACIGGIVLVFHIFSSFSHSFHL